MILKVLKESFDHKAYDQYLTNHIGNVKRAYKILTENDIFKKSEEVEKQMAQHDKSKYEPDEYNAYGEYFYGNKKGIEHKDDIDFKYAWLFHQHRNPHHHQHWLLKEDDGESLEALDMPDNYIQEMICDWMAFSISKKDINELFKWYSENKKKQIMSDKTRKSVEDYLDKIKKADIKL